MSFFGPVFSPNGREIFMIGRLLRGETMRLDRAAHQWAVQLPGISPRAVDYSRDGSLVTYSDYSDGTLWRSRADGSERRQLTFPPLRVYFPRWSPDGQFIAFAGTNDDRSRRRIYVVQSSGAGLKAISPDGSADGAPDWSRDGSTVAAASQWQDNNRVTTSGIRLYSLASGAITTVPDSAGLRYPRWSHDNRRLLALFSDGRRLLTYEFAGRKWTELAKGRFGFPNWSADDSRIYLENWTGEPCAASVAVRDGAIQNLEPLRDLKGFAGPGAGWVGLGPGDSFLVIREVGTDEYYALDWNAP